MTATECNACYKAERLNLKHSAHAQILFFEKLLNQLHLYLPFPFKYPMFWELQTHYSHHTVSYHYFNYFPTMNSGNTNINFKQTIQHPTRHSNDIEYIAQLIFILCFVVQGLSFSVSPSFLKT